MTDVFTFSFVGLAIAIKVNSKEVVHHQIVRVFLGGVKRTRFAAGPIAESNNWIGAVGIELFVVKVFEHHGVVAHLCVVFVLSGWGVPVAFVHARRKIVAVRVVVEGVAVGGHNVMKNFGEAVA